MRPLGTHARTSALVAALTVALSMAIASCDLAPSDQRTDDDKAGLGKSNSAPAGECATPTPGPGDQLAPGDFVNQFTSRANLVLADIVVSDRTAFQVRRALSEPTYGLSVRETYPMRTIGPSDWLSKSHALRTSAPVPAIISVPRPEAPTLLAILTKDFRIDQPCWYENDRERATKRLAAESNRDAILELLAGTGKK